MSEKLTNQGVRIKLLRKELTKRLGKKVRQEEFAAAAGMTRGAWGWKETNKVALSLEDIKALCIAYPDINREFLLGESDQPLLPKPVSIGNPPINIGESPTMYQSEPKNDLFSSESPPATPLPIPVFDQQPPPGLTYFDIMDQATEHMSIPRINKMKVIGVTIFDKALTGIYAAGRKICVRQIDKMGYVKYGQVYYLEIDGEQYVRHVQKYAEDEKNYLILRADKDEMWLHEDIIVARADISFMGRPVMDYGFDVAEVFVSDKAA